jgi:FKBP-type peptidyl-prolyl cis-trans isomerase
MIRPMVRRGPARIAIALGIAVLAIAGAGCGSSTPTGAVDTSPRGFSVLDSVRGFGADARPRDTLTVQHIGWLVDGTEFDNSYTRGGPFRIRGWDLGIPGMRVGGVRKLVIPPELAYGEQGVPGIIPPNATLIFAVQLLEVRRSKP